MSTADNVTRPLERDVPPGGVSASMSILARLPRTPSSAATDTAHVWPLDRVRSARTRQLGRIARDHVAARHLMSIPGVGVLSALAFAATTEEPSRFRKSRDVGAYTGLTPRRYQSGDVDYDGRISRCGDSLLRAYLFEAANVLLQRTKKWSSLKAWGLKLASKVGFKKATVAVARKLAVIVHAMWVSGEASRWSATEA